MPTQLACRESILGNLLAGQLAFTKVDLPKLPPIDKLVEEKREDFVM
jgi:hypothetical protein